MPDTTAIVAAFASFGIALLVTYFLTRRPKFLTVLDLPNDRSLHKLPVPRTGGLGIVTGLLVGFFIIVSNVDTGTVVFLATLFITAISFVDDRFGVHPGVRLIVQLISAGLLIIAGMNVKTLVLPGLQWAPPVTVSVIVTILFVTWVTNLYNFMDGMDGFAGGMAVFGFATFGVLGFLSGSPLFATLALIVAASAVGFLIFNFPPARIFMGDTGSSTLGFLVAVFALWADRDGLFPLWVSILVFSPFVVDATVTLIRRACCGAKVWVPHKTHYYQRLVEAGWSHRRTTLVEYVLMVLCGLSAIVAVQVPIGAQWTIMCLWIFLYGGLAVAVGRVEANRGINKESG